MTSPNPAPAPPANVLLVDDWPANLLALRVVLEPLGQNLVEATSGEEALRRLTSADFAVVLLDVQMPGLDGYETARLIRGRERTRRTPILFLTAYENNRLPVVEAYRLGAVDYLVKPLVPEIVRAKVAGFVELYQQAEQIKRQAEQLRQAERDARLRVEAALRDSEERHRLWVRAVKDHAIFLMDADGHITSWNEGGERLTGYRADEVIGQPFELLFTPEDRRAGMPGRELEKARSKGSATDDNWVARNDGSRFWASGFTTALRDEGGRLRGFVKICRDLTETKRLEEVLRQRAADLAEAGRRKDEFLAMLAHELRNPLAPIRNALALIRQRGGERRSAVLQALGMMERQVGHLVRLVDDLLDVARVSRGKVVLHPERLDLGGLVRSVVQDHRPAAEAAGLELTADVPDRPVWVVGDATRLSQVVGNLLDNARKFTGRGGRVGVRLTVDPGRGRAEVAVRDTGIGLVPELLPRVFEVFEQGDHGLARSHGGLGIGLALVRALVGLHGGEVRATSAGPGQGAEFAFAVPLAEAPAVTPAGAPAAAAGAARPLGVLVIDDHRDAADSERVLLETHGHRVAVAYSGQAGLEEARRRRPDVVLCDLGLPGMDGYQVARALRLDPATAAARLIAVSGYGSDADRDRAREAGFDLHLTKPVEPDALLRAVVEAARPDAPDPGGPWLSK
jgi:PAS domain S-box-containing protein